MNRKTFLLFAVAAVSIPLFSAVTTGNTLCRIKVESSTRDTLISLPLVDVGAAGDSINITKIVLTDNLSDGDTLMAKVDGRWQTWDLNGKVWEGRSTVNGDETTVASSNESFSRGTTIILTRKGEDLTKPIYLYGEFKNESKTQTPVAEGWTLMGNALPADFPINKEGFWTANGGSPSVGDQIVVPASTGLGVKEYTWGSVVDGEFGWVALTMQKDANGILVATKELTRDQVPAGQGFWYRSVGESVPTVTWNNL